jgi:hypothetical protein
VAAGTPGSKTIAGCGTFLSRTVASSGVISPVNPCTGPALFTLNMRVTKTWGFGGSRVANVAQGGDHGGGPGGDHHHGGGPGGGHGGFFGGGGGSTGQRYNFSLGATLNNIFATNDLSTPVGTLTSPYFGRSTQLAGFPYAQGNKRFRMALQASFSF